MKNKLLTLSAILSFAFVSSHAQVSVDDYLKGTPKFVVKGSSTDKVASPSDLDFNPKKTNELWVINYGGNSGSSMVVFTNAGLSDQTSKLKKDYNAYHFMCNSQGFAFGDNGNFASTSNRLDDNHDGKTFTGPTLWSSDPTVFGVTPTGSQNGTHIDMIHMNPYSTGIAFDPSPVMLPPDGKQSGNAYWVFDGYNGNIALNDFVKPHCVGCSDHDDGQIYVYKEVAVTRDTEVPSHMVLDRTNGMLYICETAKGRILWMDTKKGTKGAAMSANEGYKRYAMSGASSGVYINAGLTKPCGIDIDSKNKRLIVSDNSNGDIVIYDISSSTPVEMGRIKTGSAGIMGVKIAPDGKIWYVNFNSSQVIRIDPDVTTGINNLFTHANVSIYPNPVSAELTVSTSFDNLIAADVKMIVYDAVGKKIDEFKLQNNTSTFDLSAYNNGIYLFSIVSNNAILNNGKFVVNK